MGVIMKKYSLLTAALALGVLAAAPSAFAENDTNMRNNSGSMTSSDRNDKSMDTMTHEGKITSLDINAASPSMMVKESDGTETKIMIDPNTSTAWMNGKQAGWDQLKVGKQVKVEAMEMNGKMMAKTVQCM
jgi:hypothetical protein